MQLENKVALVTGGGSGLGSAIAARFIADGARVCITGRRKQALEEIAQSIGSENITVCAGDVSRQEDVKRMVDTTVKFGGKLNVLVNNAGINLPGAVAELDLETWQQVIGINLTGPFLTMKAVIPHMIENGGGSIINVSSLGGNVALPGMAPYCTTKAGLIMLSKQAALDYGPQKIRVNALCPGATRTEMLEGAMQGLAEVLNTDTDGAFGVMSQNIPLKRVAMPDEMVGISVFLASDESSFMTAATVLVDGGASIVDISGASLSNAGINWG